MKFSLMHFRYLAIIIFYVLPLVLFIFRDNSRVINFLYGNKAYVSVLPTGDQLVLKSHCPCKKDIIEISGLENDYIIKIINKTEYKLKRNEFNLGSITCNLYNTLIKGPNQKIISYTYSLDKNNIAKIAKKSKDFFPNWNIRIYHDNSINSSIICELECLRDYETNEYLNNIHFCNVNKIPEGSKKEIWNAEYINKMLWKWLPIGDNFVDFFITHSIDSSIGEREAVAVENWIKSKKLLLLVRDNYNDEEWKLGYASYLDRSLSNNLYSLMTYKKYAKFHTHKTFLTQYIMHLTRKNSIIYENLTLITELTSNCLCRSEQVSLIESNEHFEVIVSNNKSYRLVKKDLNLGTCNLYNTLRRGPHQKVIGYSLYGKNPRYYNELKKIVKQAKKQYPDWIIRINHDDSINSSVICELECLKNDNNEYFDNVDFCNIHKIPKNSVNVILNANYTHKMMWRWLPLGDHLVDVFMSRDSDSPLSQREVDAVSAWLNTTSLFHIMRDHPAHTIEILGGMWGFTNYRNRQLANKLYSLILQADIAQKYSANKRGPDQHFLRDHFWKYAKLNSTIHDSYLCTRFGGGSFPSKRLSNMCFVGCVGACCDESSKNHLPECPIQCRPKDHKDWNYC